MASFERATLAGGRTLQSREKNGKSKGPPRKDPLASLKMASMLDLKPVLPLELIAHIVDLLDVPDLMRFARVSRRMCEMVYEDARWVARLKKMGAWDEEAARRRDEELNRSGQLSPENDSVGFSGIRKQYQGQSQGPGMERRKSTLISPLQDDKFDSSALSPPGGQDAGGAKRKSTLISPLKEDGFDAVTLSVPGSLQPSSDAERTKVLQVLSKVQSIRGQARQEFGKVYKVLGPIYLDLAQQYQPMNALVFRQYATPEQQAEILAQLRMFSKGDITIGSPTRRERVDGAISVFEAAALQELRLGYEKRDIQGRMKQFASVLSILGDEQQSIDFFINNSRLISTKASFGSPGDAIDYSTGHGEVSLERTQMFFNRLGIAYIEEEGVINNAFPSPIVVRTPFVSAVGSTVLGPYLTALFDDAHSRGTETYVKTVAGTYAQTRRFFQEVTGQEVEESLGSAITDTLREIFIPHLDLYLGAEMDTFKQNSDSQVDEWDQALSDQAASTETFLMSNINRQADKKDFLSSFKKVVMMPVNILPSFPSLSNANVPKPAVNSDQGHHKRSSSASRLSLPPRPSTPSEAPKDELAAKAALMSSKLEGIKSLFSMEVALDIVHLAKSSVDRVAQFVHLGGEAGESAKTQCSAIFVSLLIILGTRHVIAGFDKAVNHLAAYKPREIETHNPSTMGVQPLTTFLELVNIADLIQQMLDVFYEQELIGPPVSLDRSDFLSAAVKEKKKFEQMLDERVAAGLSKGIDALMDEIEYICATTQLPTDYNVPDTGQITDVGMTETAKQVIQLVSGTVSMLVGSTEKSLLDVFNGEVGIRLFATLCKHLKRQRVSTLGSLRLIADMNAYYAYIQTLKNPDLLLYFGALRELGQIYLIDARDASDMAGVIAGGDRWRGVFRAEEVLEFAERRSDWFTVRAQVEAGLYGKNCVLM